MKSAREIVDRIASWLPPQVRGTLMVRGFGLAEIPMLALAWPTVEALDSSRCVVRVPLNRLTRNHVGSMYMGVLVAGADLAGGLMAMEAIRGSGSRVVLVFKDVHGDFLRRADGDVRFACEQGAEVRALVERAASSGERHNLPVQVTATVGAGAASAVVARFTLTISLKRRDA